MIAVTRLDGTPMIVNCDQIAWIEFMPDTVISLASGEKLIVRETPEAVVDKVRDFRLGLLERRSSRPTHGLSLASDAGGER